MAKKKVRKKKKAEIQDFLVKVKDLRKATEAIQPLPDTPLTEAGYPSAFEWREKPFQVQNMIGRWTVVGAEEEQPSRNCYRLELENGYQVDIAHEINSGNWVMIGVETELFEEMRKSK
jgi:hypothetical protein